MAGAATDAPRATVIAPAFNEEDALPVVLARLEPLRRQGIDVIVVDDGSTDGTASVARRAGVRVVVLEQNSGKAAAVRAGLAAVTTDKVIVMDADATYPAEAVPEMVRLLDEHDVVMGVRTSGREHIPPMNRFGNAVIRTAVHWFSGFRSADPLTGLYGLRRAHLEAMRLDSDGFGLEVEIGVKAARMGLRWADLPIAYGERIGTSKLNAVRDGVVIVSTLIRTLFRRPRLRPLPGREDVAAAPLAVVATALSVMALAAGAAFLLASAGVSLAAIADPSIPHTQAAVAPGLAALFAGLIGWRTSTHWGRPPARSLARVVAAATAAGAAAGLIAVRVATSLGAVSASPAAGVMSVAITAACVALAVLGLLALAAAFARPGATTALGAAVARVRASLGSPPVELAALVAISLLLAIPILRFISIGQHLGFDEAVYASTARAWVTDAPNTAWVSHRSPGISLIGLPMAVIESDVGLRLVGFAFSIGAIVGVWALGRRLGGPAVGLFSALLVAAIPALQLNGGLFLTDVPSAATFLAMMLVAWHHFEQREAPGGGLLLLAPLAAATFYLRYGAALPIAFLAATVVLLWPRSVARAWRLTLATAGLLFALLVPHFVQSTLLHGDPLAIALSAQSGAAPAYPGEALITYLGWLPSQLAGPVGGPLIALGVVALPIRALLSGLRRRRVRAHAFLALPAIGQFVLLGYAALPQARYVLLPVILLLLAGALTLVDVGRVMSRSWRQTLMAGLATAVVVTALGAAAAMIRLQAEVSPAAAHLIDAARLMRRDADGRSCSILGYPPPELIWYSGCEAHHFGYPPAAGREASLDGQRRYLMLSTGVTDREPSGALRSTYLALADPDPIGIVPSRVTGEPMLEIYLVPGDGGG